MHTLSKEQFRKLDSKLKQDDKIILEYLADVYKKNIQNPWVNINTLKAQIGGVTGETHASVAITRLCLNGLISEKSQNRNMLAISQKGLAYIYHTKNTYFGPIILIVTAISLIVSILTNNFLWLIIAILGPIISEIVKRLITKLHFIKDN